MKQNNKPENMKTNSIKITNSISYNNKNNISNIGSNNHISNIGSNNQNS